MAPEKYTTHSSASSEIHEAALPSLDFVLPDTEDFRSTPPLVSLARMIYHNRRLRQWFPSGLPSAEERWRAKSTAEFRL